eukprot:2758281-Alexandrium_andersonii.AAC.1
MRNCWRRSEPELHLPETSLRIDPWSSGWAHSMLLFAHMPNPPTKQAGGRTGGPSRGRLGGAEPPPGR